MNMNVSDTRYLLLDMELCVNNGYFKFYETQILTFSYFEGF